MSSAAFEKLERVFPRLYVALPEVGEPDVVLSAEDSPVERPFLADLVVFYGFDAESHYVIVARRDLARLGISQEELHDRALQNLRALKLQVQAHQGDRIMMLTAGGDHEAVLLLLPEVWESVSSMVSGRIVAAVPARDVLYVAGDADPDNLTALRQWTSRALEKVDKPLSRAFLLWTGEQWQEYRGYAE